MKALVFGDCHFNSSHADHLLYLDKSLTYLLSLIEEHKPDILVNLGDTFDSFASIDTKSLLAGWRWTKLLGERLKAVGGEDFFVLRGNHDTATTGESFISTFECLATPVLSPKYMGDVVLMPYTKDPDEAWTAISQNLGSIKVLFSHLDWSGYTLPSGSITRGIDAGTFSTHFPGTMVLNGHYHRPCTIGPVHFVGSPLCRDFNDADPDLRGFALYEDGKLAFLENPHRYYMAVIHAESEGDLKQQVDALPKPDETKLKLFVPKDLMGKAEVLRPRLMWLGVYQSSSGKMSVEEFSKLEVTSKPEEVIKSGVEAAPAEYDKNVLRGMGERAFR
jgi:DNA repair exonuclease SbcCD nuclease subunit